MSIGILVMTEASRSSIKAVSCKSAERVGLACGGCLRGMTFPGVMGSLLSSSSSSLLSRPRPLLSTLPTSPASSRSSVLRSLSLPLPLRRSLSLSPLSLTLTQTLPLPLPLLPPLPLPPLLPLPRIQRLAPTHRRPPPSASPPSPS